MSVMKSELSLTNREVDSSDHMFVFIILQISVGDKGCVTAQPESTAWSSLINSCAE